MTVVAQVALVVGGVALYAAAVLLVLGVGRAAARRIPAPKLPPDHQFAVLWATATVTRLPGGRWRAEA